MSGIDLLIGVKSISATTGSVAGGDTVTIKGQDFEPGASVMIGNRAATNVVVVDPNTITCKTPSNTVGFKTVTVANPDNRSARIINAFRYL